MLGSFLQENGDTDVDILQEVQDAVPKKRKDEDVFLGMGGLSGAGFHLTDCSSAISIEA